MSTMRISQLSGRPGVPATTPRFRAGSAEGPAAMSSGRVAGLFW
ncbi:hypothetical protein [Streptomyces diastatochromogenes]|nr:hypothetical protein [Streptomyces diastatochromogenes]MCZ0991602.1 hypothetical protein [Streptomyces diastatochromogenes]